MEQGPIGGTGMKAGGSQAGRPQSVVKATVPWAVAMDATLLRAIWQTAQSAPPPRCESPGAWTAARVEDACSPHEAALVSPVPAGIACEWVSPVAETRIIWAAISQTAAVRQTGPCREWLGWIKTRHPLSAGDYTIG